MGGVGHMEKEGFDGGEGVYQEAAWERRSPWKKWSEGGTARVTLEEPQGGQFCSDTVSQGK